MERKNLFELDLDLSHFLDNPAHDLYEANSTIITNFGQTPAGRDMYYLILDLNVRALRLYNWLAHNKNTSKYNHIFNFLSTLHDTLQSQAYAHFNNPKLLETAFRTFIAEVDNLDL